MTGFEQVISGNVATYYLLDWATTRVITYKQDWTYVSYKSMPYQYSYDLKYVNGFFFVTSDNYFYKTDSNFNSVAAYGYWQALYRQLYYDSTTSLIYTAPFALTQLHVFTTSCTLSTTISLSGFSAYGISSYNGALYTGIINGNQVFAISNKLITRMFYINTCSSGYTYQILSITFDSFGNMAITCQANRYITVYDYNGNTMNALLTTAGYPFISKVDSMGRFIVMANSQLEIYY